MRKGSGKTCRIRNGFLESRLDLAAMSIRQRPTHEVSKSGTDSFAYRWSGLQQLQRIVIRTADRQDSLHTEFSLASSRLREFIDRFNHMLPTYPHTPRGLSSRPEACVHKLPPEHDHTWLRLSSASDLSTPLTSVLPSRRRWFGSMTARTTHSADVATATYVMDRKTSL